MAGRLWSFYSSLQRQKPVDPIHKTSEGASQTGKLAGGAKGTATRAWDNLLRKIFAVICSGSCGIGVSLQTDARHLFNPIRGSFFGLISWTPTCVSGLIMFYPVWRGNSREDLRIDFTSYLHIDMFGGQVSAKIASYFAFICSQHLKLKLCQ